MIKVLIEKEGPLKSSLLEKSGIKESDVECVAAKDGEELLGYCLFSVSDKKITIKDISPRDDILMADGVLRTALHIASERFIFNADYDNDDLTELLNNLKFIKNDKTREIDIDKLFRPCAH